MPVMQVADIRPTIVVEGVVFGVRTVYTAEEHYIAVGALID